MWRIEKQFRFEAAHYLPYHDGKCARLHGHSWVGTMIVEGDQLKTSGAQTGMVVDFGFIKDAIQPVIDHMLDHQNLNATFAGEIESPTSEALAKWIFDRFKDIIPGLAGVRIEETCTSAAEYSE